MRHYIFVRNQSRSRDPLLLLVSLCRAPNPTKISYALGTIKMIETPCGHRHSLSFSYAIWVWGLILCLGEEMIKFTGTDWVAHAMSLLKKNTKIDSQHNQNLKSKENLTLPNSAVCLANTLRMVTAAWDFLWRWDHLQTVLPQLQWCWRIKQYKIRKTALRNLFVSALL